MNKRFAGLLLPLLLTLSCIVFANHASALTRDQLCALLETQYIDVVPQRILELPTIQEIIAALGDPYTRYLDAETYAEYEARFQEMERIDIGVIIEPADTGWFILRVFEESGAFDAGMRDGETIISVAGESVAGLEVAEAKDRLSGEEGHRISLNVMDAKGTVRDVVVSLRPYSVRTVEITQENDGRACIFSTAFGPDTFGLFAQGIQANKATARTWVVDLRANGGGYVDPAVEAASTLTGTPERPMATLKGRSSTTEYYGASERLGTAPAVVVISPKTASSGELFAGILRDLHTGVLVGTRTYGKGVAQGSFNDTNFPLQFAEGDALLMTMDRNYTYANTTTHLVGVIPDLLIPDENSIYCAFMLSGESPADSAGHVSISLRGVPDSYYIDLPSTQINELSRGDLQVLLESLPPTAEVALGAGGTTWVPTSATEVAARYCSAFNPRTFPDASGNADEQAINTLAAYQLLQGSGDGQFRPKDAMTRAELCVAVSNVLNATGDPAQAASVFADVPATAWYAGAVARLYSLGFIEGMGDGSFHPDAPVTHEQLLAVCARFGAWLNLDLEARHEAIVAQDASAVQVPAEMSGFASWSRPAAHLLDEAGLLQGSAMRINPAGVARRDEAAVLLYRLLCKVGILRA